MAINRYITLQNAGATLTKRFRVMFEGFQPDINRIQNSQPTLSGKMDTQYGATNIRTWQMVFRVKETEADSNYGDRADIETFFGYNSPPNTNITFTDHAGTEFTVTIMGAYSPKLQVADYSAADAWWAVPILLQEASE
jgi:hypothetical protein